MKQQSTRPALRAFVAFLSVCVLVGFATLQGLRPIGLRLPSLFTKTESKPVVSFEEKLAQFDNLMLQKPLQTTAVHYTSVNESQWPIDLGQYSGRYVFRVRYAESDTYASILRHVAQTAEISIWANSVVGKFVDIESTPEAMRTFVASIYAQVTSYFDVEFMVQDLPQAIFESYPQAEESSDEAGITVDLFFRKYRDLATIYAWFDLLVQTYPDLLQVVWIGQTYEGRDLKALRVSSHSEDTEDVRTVVITGGVHAREWISTSSACYILYHLIEDYQAGNADAKYFLDNMDFLFIPVTNPDGYEYSWKSDRLWRKNRQETYHPRCWGIDIDHSFDFHFQKSEDLPCGEDYSGEEAFESLESRIINQYLNDTKHKHSIHGYIDLHSYAQEVLYPYAFSCSQMPRDEENLLELAYGLSKAIRLSSGKVYSVLSACQDKGADFLPALGSGSALDYMYHNRAYWAFQLKLRDSGNHGFLLPSRFIEPVGEEIYSAIKYFATFVLNPE